LLPLIGDPDYLPWLFERFERQLITQSEWHQCWRAHKFVVMGQEA
jgi:hypothetical protein